MVVGNNNAPTDNQGENLTMQDQMTDTNDLPELLLLDEERVLDRNAGPDDVQHITTGWRARSEDGVVFYRDNELTPVEQWLSKQGYVDTGDGVHYQMEASPRPSRDI
jgi:hypothetical protein